MTVLDIDYLAGWRDELLKWAIPRDPRLAEEPEGDSWTRVAARFRDMSRTFRADQDPFMARLSPWLDTDATVLEIGAGAGRLTRPVAERVRQVVAVESSPAMRTILAEELEAAGLKNVEIVSGTWPAVQVGAVDLAFCSHVLYDVADLGPFLTAMNDVARRACFIYLTVRHPFDSFRDLLQTFRHWTAPTRPTYLDAAQCLYQLGILPNAEVAELSTGLSFGSLDEALPFYRERIGMAAGSADENALRAYLAAHGEWRSGRWFPHHQMRKVAILWWTKGS
jgi:SAM-dependent methyltransferase